MVSSESCLLDSTDPVGIYWTLLNSKSSLLDSTALWKHPGVGRYWPMRAVCWTLVTSKSSLLDSTDLWVESTQVLNVTDPWEQSVEPWWSLRAVCWALLTSESCSQWEQSVVFYWLLRTAWTGIYWPMRAVCWTLVSSESSLVDSGDLWEQPVVLYWLLRAACWKLLTTESSLLDSWFISNANLFIFS